MAGEFLTDEQMALLEAQVNSAPAFISDEQMAALEASQGSGRELSAVEAPQSRGQEYARAIGAPVSSFLKSIPFADEAVSGLNAIGGKGLNIASFGLLGDSRPVSEQYNESQSIIKQLQDLNSEVNPEADIAASIIPALLAAPAAGSLAAKTAGKVVSKVPLARNIPAYATRLPVIVQNVGKGAAIGATEGAVYGLGEQEGGRGVNALVNAMGGGVFGGAAGAVSDLASKAIKRLPRAMKYSPVEQKLASKLTHATDDELISALKQMKKADDLGNPLFLHETDDIGGYVDNLADYVANSDATGGIAKKAVKARTNQGMDRVLKKLDDVSPSASVLEGNKKLVKSAADKIDSIKELRKEAAAPLYDEAKRLKPIIKTEKMDQLLGIKKVPKNSPLAKLVDQHGKPLVDTVEEGSKTGKGFESAKFRKVIEANRANYPELGKLPPNHISNIQAGLQSINDEMQFALRNEQMAKWERLKDLKDAILDEVGRENPTFLDANKVYSQYSGIIGDLNDTQVGIIKDLADKRIKTAAKKIFELEPQQIKELRASLGNDDSFLSGVRAFIQDQVENTTTGRNAVTKLIGSSKGRAKLKAAGISDSFIDFLQNEERIALGKNRVASKSDTAIRQSQTMSPSKIARILTHPKRSVVDFVSDLATGLSDEQERLYHRELAEALFDNRKGAELLGTVQAKRLAEQVSNAERSALADALIKRSVMPPVREGVYDYFFKE